jgi:hypothetical protein
MRQTSIIFLLLIVSTFVCAQKSTVDLTLHTRADTTNKEVMEIVQLWKNYLSSSPDKTYDNP